MAIRLRLIRPVPAAFPKLLAHLQQVLSVICLLWLHSLRHQLFLICVWCRTIGALLSHALAKKIARRACVSAQPLICPAAILPSNSIWNIALLTLAPVHISQWQLYCALGLKASGKD